MIEFIRTLWGLTRPYKVRFFLGICTGVLSGMAGPLMLVTVAFVFGVVFFGAQDAQLNEVLTKLPDWIRGTFLHVQGWLGGQVSGSKATLILVVSLIPLVMLINGVLNYLNAYLMNWVAIRAICDLRARLFEHLLSLPASFFSRTSTGELISRNSDIGALQNMVGASLVTLIKEPISVLTYASIPLAINAKLTFIALVTFPFCVIPVAVYTRKLRKAGAAIQTEQANLSKVMHESFTGNRIIKAYNLEQVVTNQFKTNLGHFISHYMRAVRSTELPGPLIEFLGAIGISVLFLYLAGGTSPAKFMAFIAALLAMYRPIKTLIRMQSQVHQVRAGTRRVFELLATSSSLVDPLNPMPLKAANGEIHFDNVSFDYGNKPVLRDIQLRVKPGQMVALVGSSGSGKTTLSNLLLRFYDPTQGVVRIGGIDLRQVAIRDLRSQVAVVSQEIILFDDTIRNNIAFGRQGASDADVEQAAKHAFAHEFIMEKPRGYDTMIGEKGVTLSVGQRQRIAIARAILKNAPILVLDEATSALDNESERVVQAAFDQLMKGRTTICIAHRLSTIQHADVILVLDQGQIVETGRHDELMNCGGIYYKLQMLQFKKAL